MTTCAIITQGHLMHIGMAGDARGADRLIEHERSVTGAAIDATMHAHEGHGGAVVIERDRIDERGPTVRNVARRAVHLQGVSVRGLGDRGQMHA